MKQPSSISEKKPSVFRSSDLTMVLTILIGFVAVMFVIELAGGQFKFFTANNWLNILMQNAVIGIMAMGMTIVMISGGIDLSVGYLASLGGIFIAKGVVDWGIPIVPAVILGILICVGLEAMLGAIIARLEVEPFIITLGGSIAFRGIALLMCQSREVVMSGQLEGFKTNLIEGAKAPDGLSMTLPIYVVIFIVIAVIVWWVLKYTKYGRRIYAVGANPSAAYLAGINVKNIKLSSYVINGLLVGLASVLLLSRVGTAIITMGERMEIDVIAAVVIGGVAMSGGKGNAMGTFLGVILLGAITNGMTVLKLQSEWQFVAKGAIIIAAVAAGAISSKIAARGEVRQQKQEALAEQAGEGKE
ncbi:ABC transporter permease [Christensenella minuta]|uniref:ABC transporter permease n=1 Tax=Christensenella minuta TaxID=626937 RepID=UPI002157A186|nr:ABC transporter permease [Christensenella minuta]